MKITLNLIIVKMKNKVKQLNKMKIKIIVTF